MEVEQGLSKVLSEFARTLVTDFPIQAILDHLVERIVDVLPIDAAGVTLISPGVNPRYLSASDERALRFEQLQTELGEGPCVAAYMTGEAVVVPDLRREDRFPKFTPRALEEGLVAVFAFPLRQGDDQLGALDLYRTTAGPLDERTMAAAQTLADVAAAYLINAQARVALRESSERAQQNSLHDPLTGLPNRTLLVQRLDHAVQRCRRSKKLLAILFADLDMFKAVNDTYGHHVGDELLVAVGERLTSLLRPGDTMARLAGDEFVILCEDLDDAAQVEALAARIDDALAETFVLSSAVVRVTASVGIAFAGEGHDIPRQVLQDADTAMYQAKRQGGGRHAIIDLREQHRIDNRVSLSRDLPGALGRGELQIEYQPIVGTGDQQISGMEAHLCWQHPEYGTVDPDDLVGLAEQSGLITELGGWLLEHSCLDRHRWNGQGRSDEIGISVNVSANQLMAPSFASTVESVIADTETAPQLVTLDVTESVFLRDKARALVVLNDLKSLGITLALEGFGTGYSSLSYLKQLPIDIVKIDRLFIADIDHDSASRHIVGAIAGLCHGLGMVVVAEGVETLEQRDAVAALGCDFYQGLFAPPLSGGDRRGFLAETAATA